MFASVVRIILLLGCVDLSNGIFAQEFPLRFTSNVTNPVPILGQPFTLTWTGKNSDTPVYIVLNYLFPDTPNQDIPYFTTDILSNGSNTGSWVYDVPPDITQGRYTFSIGETPFMFSDTTGVFVILPSQTSTITAMPASVTTGTAATQNHNARDLASDSSSTSDLWGFASSVDPSRRPLFSSGDLTSSGPVSLASAFAKDLQCSASATATTTEITASGTATIFSVAGCFYTGVITGVDNGFCHSSAYSTYSVSGENSVCCPTGWATTPLVSTIYCYTSLTENARKAVTGQTQTVGDDTTSIPVNVVILGDRVFTPAGVVSNAIAVATNSSSSSTLTSASVGAKTTTSGSDHVVVSGGTISRIVVLTAILYHMWSLA